MPYTPRSGLLRNVINAILEEAEFKKALALVELSADWIRSQLLKIDDRIWKSAAPAIAEYDLIEQQLTERAPPSLSRLARAGKTILWITLFVTILAALIWTSVYAMPGFRANWLQASLRWLKNPLYQYALGILGLAVVLILARVGWETRRINRQVNSPERRSLFAGLVRKQAEIEDKIIPDVIRQEFRALIDRHAKPSYELQLTVADAPGLAEIYNPAYDISTKTVEQLHFMLKTMPGGSIGIAGPRGAGKSTLLRTFCHEAITKLDGRDSFPVLTSAPVEYEARDFILYLFGAMCRRIIGTQRGSESLLDADSTPALRSILFYLSRFLLPILFGIGVIALAASFWLAYLNLSSKLVVNAQHTSSRSQVAQPPKNPASTEAPTRVTFLGYVTEMGLNPALLFKWALGLLVLSMISYYYRRTLYHLERGHSAGWQHDLRDQAVEWLREIRFQQSYTTGWSGALKLPIGAETSLNRATTLAQRQLTLPEITDGFVQLLKKIASGKIVVIGIDEMDKLSSDDKAQRFLNDLKSIFGVENVFYLVSVSESAMSSFERRGLPFRDAFDSAFDSIIYIDYLDFRAARSLLARRVVGLPVQFAAVCYTIAGGLPRDLLRACRAIMDIKRTARSCELPNLSYLLIQAEVASKWRAALVTIERIQIEPARTSILSTLYQLRPENEASSWIEAAVQINDASANVVAADNAAEPSEKLKVEKLKALCAELATYLYFCATLRELFVSSLDQPTFNSTWEAGYIDQLARARQAFSVDYSITKSMIDRCRQELGMKVVSFSKTKSVDGHT